MIAGAVRAVGVVALLSALLLAGARAQERANGKGALVYTRPMVGMYLATGDDPTQIGFSQGVAICPRLLPRQPQVVLNSLRGGRPGIWLQDIGDSDRLRICDGDQVGVAPSGKSIVFRRDGAIVERELASGTERVVSPPGWTTCSYPSYAGGGRVLFVAADKQGDALYLADRASPAPPRPLLAGEIRSAPRASPDVQMIAYQDGPHLYLFDLRTRQRRRLTLAAGVQSWPMWSQDGKRVAYLQASGPVDGPWHVYRVAIDEPRQVRLVLRDVEPGPDWDGVGFPGGELTALKGDEVRLLRSEAPLLLAPGAEQLPKPAAGWRELPVGARTTKGDVLVGCGWGGVYLSTGTGRVLLAERKGEVLARTAELRVTPEQGAPVERIESVSVAEIGVDETRVAMTCALLGGGTAKAALRVSRTRPVVQVEPMQNVGGMLVRRSLQLAVVPDRLADDLVYRPADAAALTVALPRAPFVLGMTSSGSGLVMVATPSRKQTLELVRSESQQAFAGVQARCGGESVIVAVLPGRDLWRGVELKAPAEGKPWELTWSCPFAAQWRLTTRSEGRGTALMRMLDAPTSEEAMPLPELQGLATAPTQAVLYTYGRSANSALDRTSPTDVLYEALGLDGAARLLDVEGVRTYRHAEQPVVYKDPRVALKCIAWIRRRDRPEAQAKIDDLCREMVLSLQGLEAREREYEQFVGRIERLAAPRAASGPGKPYPEWLAAQVRELRQALREAAVTRLDKVAQSVEAFRRDPQADRDALSTEVTGALSQRLAVLAVHRRFAKDVRDGAGLALAKAPEMRDLGDDVRKLAGQVLRRRYYLEGDWAGEQPLGGPEAFYEQIADL